jgi:hypothetical protein
VSGQDGGDWTRRINWTLFWTAVGSIAAVAALLVALDVFPSSDSDGGESPAIAKTDEGDPESSEDLTEGTGGGSEADDTPTGEKLWGGEISLVVNENYALDGFPIEPFEGFCDGCIMVNSFTPELSLEVENGVRDWTEPTPPTYEDCVQLLDSGPAPSVSLVTSPNTEGVETGEWACAFSKSGEILRLRYLGESQDEVNLRFMATGWRAP